MARADIYNAPLLGSDEQPTGWRLRRALAPTLAAVLLMGATALLANMPVPKGGAAVLSLVATSVGENKAMIHANMKKLYKLETVVNDHKFAAYLHRAGIEENRDLILNNYDAAFRGNRKLANLNTDKIFENREAILGALPAADRVQQNWVLSMINEAKVDYLEHRSKLNSLLPEVSKMMGEANSQLIAVNLRISETNKRIVDFNSKNIANNEELLDGTLNPENATRKTNAHRIASNVARIAEIGHRAAKNAERIKANVKTMKENSESIKKNAELIEARREVIETNQQHAFENSEKVSSMFADHASSSTDSVGEAVVANAAKILANKKHLYDLETVVVHNEFLAYDHRALIEENRDALLRNYLAAFRGNRQLGNFNTDQIFANRAAVLNAIDTTDEVQENWVHSMLNEAKVDYLEHRSELNGHLAEVSAIMASFNTQLISVNARIMEGNEGITEFNAKRIATNTELLAGSLNATGATPESNAERIESNAARVAEIEKRASANSELIEANSEILKRNKKHIEKNAELMHERLEDIEENHEHLLKNAKKIADLF